MIFFNNYYYIILNAFKLRPHSVGAICKPWANRHHLRLPPVLFPVVYLPLFLFVSHSHYYVNVLLSIFALRSPQGRGAVQRFCEICVCRGDSQWSARSDEPVFIVLCASVALYILFCHRGRLTAESLGPTEFLSVCACCGRFVCFFSIGASQVSPQAACCRVLPHRFSLSLSQ